MKLFITSLRLELSCFIIHGIFQALPDAQGFPPIYTIYFETCTVELDSWRHLIDGASGPRMWVFMVGTDFIKPNRLSIDLANNSFSKRNSGTICQDTPYLSFSQPHWDSLPPSLMSSFQRWSTSFWSLQFTNNEIIFFKWDKSLRYLIPKNLPTHRKKVRSSRSFVQWKTHEYFGKTFWC